MMRITLRPAKRRIPALDAVTDYTRVRMREDSFVRRIMEPIPINNDFLDRSVPTDEPVRVVDNEPDSLAAVSGFSIGPSVGHTSGIVRMDFL